MNSIITATGSYLPKRIMTNDDVSRRVDTSDAWIRERTGITQRHIVAEGEFTSHMATHAAQKALEMAGYGPDMIDGIVVATSTPDSTMPSTAAKVQAALGIKHGAVVDVAAACTGFIYALSVAHGWIQTGLATRVIVIGAETMSRIIDWNDRGTCILFGDGAGAVILENGEAGGVPSPLRGGLGRGAKNEADTLHAPPSNLPPQGGEASPAAPFAHIDNTRRGILAIMLDGNGEFAPLLGTNGGVSATQTAGHLFMEGQEVFRHGVEKMAGITQRTLAKAGLNIADVDWLIPHQANARMIRMIGRTLRIADSKCVVTVDRHANTSAATIPLALDEANRDGRLKKGNILALPALGAGLTWGCAVVCW
jgi:3-oxoacyl-[acyl-carrier-protein] synthase-3